MPQNIAKEIYGILANHIYIDTFEGVNPQITQTKHTNIIPKCSISSSGKPGLSLGILTEILKVEYPLHSLSTQR